MSLPGSEAPPPLRPVLKLTVEYDRDPQKPANEDIEVCVFSLTDGKISLQYHLEEGRITANTRDFLKPETSDDAMAPPFDPDCTTAFKVDPSAPDPKVSQLSRLLDQLIEQESSNIVDVSLSNVTLFPSSL